MYLKYYNKEIDFNLLENFSLIKENQISDILEMVKFDEFLNFAYVTLLNRAPDREGRMYYQGLILSGSSRPAIVRRLLSSQEYRQALPNAPELSNEEFVNRAYKDTLGRWPDAEGLQYYTSLAARKFGRQRVLRSLARSSEAQRRDGGRYGRILALRKYAKSDLLLSIPLLGLWLARQREHERRIIQIELQVLDLNFKLAGLRRQLVELEWDSRSQSEEVQGTVDQSPAETLFRKAMARAAQDRRMRQN